MDAVYTGENSISVYCLSITLWASFERKRKVLPGLQVKKVNAGKKLDCYTLLAYSLDCTPLA